MDLSVQRLARFSATQHTHTGTSRYFYVGGAPPQYMHNSQHQQQYSSHQHQLNNAGKHDRKILLESYWRE